jgi:transglutaminase-like putative cysteine protease
MNYPHSRILQLTIVALLCLSGQLLGSSHGSQALTIIAVSGALAGFVLVDLFRWFHLSGWMANVASVLILIIAMKDFLDGDSATKLMSVAKLLVYLQTVLIFQKKTPRLYWQILVLSFLQVVVAAIFNLQFEAGQLFLLYSGVAILALVLQLDFSLWFENRLTNNQSFRSARDHLSTRSAQGMRGQPPLVISRAPISPINFFRSVPIALTWLFSLGAFAVVLFFLVPRSNELWSSPGFREPLGTGASRTIELNQTGVIEPSGDLVFRATFFDLATEEPVQLADVPYFRGMPLPRLTIENKQTVWKAANDSVYPFSYRPIARQTNNTSYGTEGKLLGQSIVLERTEDPLLFACCPFYATRGSRDEVEFCNDLSAITRRRQSDYSTLTGYQYVLATIVDADNFPLVGWPYIANSDTRQFFSLEHSPGEFLGLTYLDRGRYPTIVRTADRIVSNLPDRDAISICRALESYFTAANGFQYTLDFRGIRRREGADVVEDFFANHRTGHCELYASALALMLRSQGIAAQVVTGFYGSEFNKLAANYVVRAKHAHAWVEAYIPPTDCTAEMNRTGAAGQGGAWLTLDSTPPIEAEDNSQPLGLARRIWQDYMMNMESDEDETQVFVNSIAGRFEFLDFGRLRPAFSQFLATLKEERTVRPITGVILLLVVLWVLGAFWIVRRAGQTSVSPQNTVSGVRQLLGRTISIFSPRLGRWVAGDLGDVFNVWFYERMIKALRQQRMVRKPSQTQREFAMEVKGSYANELGPSELSQQLIQSVDKLTEAFYQVRFGRIALDADAGRDVEQALKIVEHKFEDSARRPPKL